MNSFIVVLLLLNFQVARPQITTGTVVVVDFAKEVLTIAADSRGTDRTGGHNDTECKISAFGNQFVFAMAGAIPPGNQNPHYIARQIWSKNSLVRPDAKEPANAIAKEWVTQMEQIYKSPEIIRDVRKRTAGDVLANAFFATLDSTGQISLVGANIDFDGELFDKSEEIQITHDVQALPVNWYGAGHDEIAEEFVTGTTDRAKQYLTWFKGRISNLTPYEQRAKLAFKLVELSILLHPTNAELGFPIDVVQLRPTIGVSWPSIKSNCSKY